MEATTERHPRGIYTLFFTEMWERMSYYGMRGLLVLFMVDAVSRGGLGLSDEVATAIYGLYTAAVYLVALPGGWIADRLLGGQRAVWYGGCLITAGHFALAVPQVPFFFSGLLLVVLGTGLLKPNISTLVGQLYPEGGARRDAGFTLFYMGINLGAAIGPLVCSALGEKLNWHYGFGAAGIGMLAGLIQFRLTRHHLGTAGLVPPSPPENPGRLWLGVGLGLVAIALIAGLALAGVLPLNPVWLASRTAAVIVGLALAYFGWVLLGVKLEPVERGRVIVIIILFLAAALFWSGYEQAGSSLNLFADRYTNRTVNGFEVPAGWFQSLPAIFVIVFAPVVAWIWLGLARRGRNPSLVVKLAWGLVLLSSSFLVLMIGSKRALAQGTVWPTWLILTYLLQVFGELLLSPVGLSSVTKLAPARLAGQMMGVWFLAASLGNLLAGLLAGQVTGANASAMPAQFLQVTLISGVAGALLLVLARPIRRLMGGVT
ncbi:MAG: peptide MFS transporter [Verrucomicrobia bacterium]|nr:peptide MFS transporter [Verrucomicrobiota bacterium]